MTSTRDTALALLQKTYGYDSFRGSQAEIIDHVVTGGNAFVLMPTGGGKSLCYQIPSLLRPGVGVIVSPLIALMQDQVDALTQLGIRAAAINSNMEASANAKTMRAVRDGTLDLLYVAPERLLMDDFLDFLGESQVALFAIDEAHCVSQWGHDFRPHYVQLSTLAERFPNIPRIALTATADGTTRKDIVERLHLAEGRTFVEGFDRPNIRYAIEVKKEARKQLLQFIRESHPRDSGIVYCLSRKLTEETAEWLSQQGRRALPYHAGLAPEVRARNQERFLREDNIIMVATIAFGMGIDKPDVRFVVHMNIPKNIEAYYQETGRAGRDGLPANALMLYSMGDSTMLRKFIDDSEAAEQQKRIEHKKLNALLGLCEAASCRRSILLEYFGDTGSACGNCDNCLAPAETFDATLAAQKAISCCYRTGQRFGVGYLIEVLLGNADDRMRQFRHDKVSTFGIGKEHEKPEWQGIYRQLIALGLLSVDTTEFGSVVITDRGFQFLKEKSELKLRKSSGGRSRSTRRSTEAPKDFEWEEDRLLFEKLQTKCAEHKVRANLSSGLYFNKATLREIVACKPETAEELSFVSGVGPEKFEGYADVVMEIIRAHVEKYKDSPSVAARKKAVYTVAFENKSDEEFFEVLRAWRVEQAREQGVPPYIIFLDKTLRSVVAKKPISLSELSQISGVGQAKLEHYGADILGLVQRHRDKLNSPA
jgi:ATP-dependent DNA helicase RecQ